MARLNDRCLNESSISLLNQSNICTILDYLQEDPEKLSSFSNTSFKEVIEIRQSLITNFSALPISGTLGYENLLSSSALIPTGIKSLDTLLHGGFLTGSVLELCGVSGEGKTQLCLTISAHVAYCLKQVVHYVDTKGDFSAERVFNIIKHKNVSEEECKSALGRINVTRIQDIFDLIRFLHHLKQSLGEDDSSPPRLVIVDSMPALYFPFMGSSDSSQGFGLLSNVMAAMKVMATEFHILFIEINIASTFLEAEGCVGELEEETTNEVRPMLGKYWLHAPHTRLHISKLNSEASQRLIRVTKSTYLPLGASCVVSMSEQGVV